MSLKYYTLSELKQLSLDSARRFRAEYTFDDAGKAYNHASAVCGFENPPSTDPDYSTKQFWLVEQMNLWFYKDIQREYLIQFDVGDLKLGQVSRNLREIIATVEASFSEAQESPTTAHLFVDSTEVFSDCVVDTGLIDDIVGQDYREES